MEASPEQAAICEKHLDELQTLGFDIEQLGTVATGFGFFQELAHAGKIAQGRFIASRR